MILARFRSPALRGIWLGLACALVSWLAVQWSLLGGLEDWTLDSLFSWRGQRHSNARIVLIGLDTPSLAEVKKPLTSLSPELAEVIRYVRGQGAAAIGIDVLLPADREQLPALQPGEEGDALTMGEAVRAAHVVTLPVWRLREGWVQPVWQWRLKADTDGEAETADLGFVNWQEDDDQFVRRQQLP